MYCYVALQIKIIGDLVKSYEVVGNCDVVVSYSYHHEFERFTSYKLNWNTTTFKKVCSGLGYRINPCRDWSRWLICGNIVEVVNTENSDIH